MPLYRLLGKAIAEAQHLAKPLCPAVKPAPSPPWAKAVKARALPEGKLLLYEGLLVTSHHYLPLPLPTPPEAITSLRPILRSALSLCLLKPMRPAMAKTQPYRHEGKGATQHTDFPFRFHKYK